MNRGIKVRLSDYRGLTTPKKYVAARKKVRAAFNLNLSKQKDQLKICDQNAWKKTFMRMIMCNPDLCEVAVEFYNNPPKLVKDIKIDKDEPIVITLVKNDPYRIKKFLSHYRNIGIKQFAIIDNNSDDDTSDILLLSDDVAVFHAEVPYTTNRREAWINRIYSFYGYDMWYIVADPDELLVYPGMEEHPIKDVLTFGSVK